MIKHLPNFITVLNLISGCVGIWLISKGEMIAGSYMIYLSAIFDFFDGFVARATKSYSAIGKELDSLADMVSFGVLPGMILAEMMSAALYVNGVNPSLISYLTLSGFIITAFSALRLAKFNIDTRQSDNFLGLPTPMNAIFISSLPSILYLNIESVSGLLLNHFVLGGILILNSYLLVSEIPLMALKFKDFSLSNNLSKYIFLIASVILILWLKMLAIPIVFVLYILISIITLKRNEIQS